MAVAVFKQPTIEGEAVAIQSGKGTRLRAVFTKLPAGKHGFHIHVAGDLRGEGCAGACAHLHMGPPVSHGGAPHKRRTARTRKTMRHSGDLGNIQLKRGAKARYSYYLPDLKPSDLWGRSLIVHADEDDLGKGHHEDSKTTGHSGARIGCAIFGRLAPCAAATTRKQRDRHTAKQHGGVVLEVEYAQVLGGNNASPTTLDVPTMTSAPFVKVMNTEPAGVYSLIMYDPDAVSATPGQKVNYLHWLLMNRSADAGGDTCLEYKAPNPPSGTGIHRYTFVLYKQPQKIGCAAPAQRSPFDLDAFVKTHGLVQIQKVVFEIDSSQ